MEQMITTIGAMRFRLSRLEYPAVSPEFSGKPFLCLDGTDVEVCGEGSEKFLFVDHRRDRRGPARIEFWESIGATEGELAGLYAVSDARDDMQRRPAG
jgi:hypothetical protein